MSKKSNNYYCFVDGCTASFRDKVSLFRFPKDPVRCEQWKQELGLVGEHPFANVSAENAYTSFRICSAHFDETSFTASGKRLISSAVPSKSSPQKRREYPTSTSKAPPKKNKICTMNTQTTQTSYTEKCDVSTQTWKTNDYGEINHASCQTAAYLSNNTPWMKKMRQELCKTKEALRKSEKASKVTTLPNVIRFLEKHYPEEAVLVKKKASCSIFVKKFKTSSGILKQI